LTKTVVVVAFILIFTIFNIAAASGQPQTKLIVTVNGDQKALNSTLTLVIKQNGRYEGLSCKLQAGVCELNVSAKNFYVIAVYLPYPMAVKAIWGNTEKRWTGGWDSTVRYGYKNGRIVAYTSLQPAVNGSHLELNIYATKACIVRLAKNATESASFRMDNWVRWRLGVWEDREAYYVVVLRSGSAWLRVNTYFQGRLKDIMRELAAYGIIDSYRETLTTPVYCSDGNTTLAFVVYRALHRSISEYMVEEAETLTRLGFKAGKYIQDLNYSLGILNQGVELLKDGDIEEGGALAEKGLISSYLAIQALKNAESDSVISFLLLLVLTFFISTIAVNLVETEKRGLAAIALFAALVVGELVFLPQARMALYVLTPQYISRSSSSIGFSLFASFVTLGVILSLAFFAKGTFLSDMFWYTVKNMRKRKLRAVLTIVSIAVVAAASAFYLSLGSATIINKEKIPSSFQGLSVSSHVTTITYIFRGVDIGTEVIVKEYYQPISPGIVKWLCNMPWAEKKYLVAAAPVNLKRKWEPPVKAYFIATNATNISGAWISKALAEKLGIKEGDKVSVNGVELKVTRIIKEPPRLVDGLQLEEFKDMNFIIVQLSKGAQMPVYRVILQGKPPENTVEALLKIGYDKTVKRSVIGGQQGTAEITVNTYKSYRICYGDGEATTCKYIFGEVQRFSGTPEFIVILAISSLTIATVLLGSIYEKRKEYSTMTSLGASPGHIALILLIEGFTYGIIGGASGYLLASVLETAFHSSTAIATSQAVGQIVVCFAVAIVPSIIGSLVPARKAILYVVPSRSMMVKGEEIRIKEDHVEAELPLRILGDEELFAEYVKNLAGKHPPIEWGPLYMSAEEHRQNGELDYLELLVSFKGKRSALYKVRIYPQKGRKANLRIEAYAAKGAWGVEHKTTAKDLILAIRADLLDYVEWKKKRATRGD